MSNVTEFWLQKKAFNSWSHVTWYPTEEECRKNFDKVAVEGNGYSWRMVSVEVIEERLLHDETPVMRSEDEEPYVPNENTTSIPVKDWRKLNMGVPEKPKSAWGAEGSSWGTPKPSNGDHGMIGKVWLGNPVTKEKKRVDPSLVAGMMADGWVKAGPRTVL